MKRLTWPLLFVLSSLPASADPVVPTQALLPSRQFELRYFEVMGKLSAMNENIGRKQVYRGLGQVGLGLAGVSFLATIVGTAVAASQCKDTDFLCLPPLPVTSLIFSGLITSGISAIIGTVGMVGSIGLSGAEAERARLRKEALNFAPSPTELPEDTGQTRPAPQAN